MKKALTVLALLLVLSTSVFANHRITVNFDPFTFQSFVQKDGDVKEKINSKYGIGGGIGYNWESDKGLILGADIKADTYFIEDQKNFTDVSFLAKVGYIAKVCDTVRFYANMEAGLDIQTHNNETSAVLEFGPELGFEYKFNDNFDVFASCEGLFGFPKKDEIKYSEFRVTPAIGLGYSF